MKLKKIFLIAPTLLLIILAAFVQLVKRSPNNTDVTPETVPNRIPTPVSYQKTSLPDRLLSDSVFSPEGDFLLYLDARKGEGLWKIELTLSPQRHSFEIDGGNYNVLKSWSKNEDDTRDYVNNFQAAWSEDGKKFAVIIDGNLIIKNLESYERTDEADNIRLVRTVYTTHDVVEKSVGIRELENPIFSKRGDKLFASTDSGLHEIWPEENLIDLEIADYFPLPERDGFAYSKEEDENSGEYKLIVLTNDKKSVYSTPIVNMDSVSNIMMSPSLVYVCAELGFSGHHGYTIFRLGSTNDILTGQQYSYCIKWLDNFHVIVKEIPYFHQWTTEYYLVDARTGKRELLENYRNRDR